MYIYLKYINFTTKPLREAIRASSSSCEDDGNDIILFDDQGFHFRALDWIDGDGEKGFNFSPIWNRDRKGRKPGFLWDGHLGGLTRGTMFYGSIVWDPWLILSQIVCLQCLYYLTLGFLMFIFVGFRVSRLSLVYLFDFSILTASSATGWCAIAAFLLSSLAG